MDEFSCRRIANDKKTDWFPALTDPKHPGFYERRWWYALRYWDGKNWRRGGPKGRFVFPQQWRGMKTPNDLDHRLAAPADSPRGSRC